MLLIQLSVITLVLVLPQVDLLDTAFQNNSEPLTIHAVAIASPLVLIAVAASGRMHSLVFHNLDLHSLKTLSSSAASLVFAVSPLRC